METYNRGEVHRVICDRLNDTYRRKNSDYGNSFTKVREEYPDAILIRLSDKMERQKALKKGKERMVEEESVEDSLLDLANYAIMELVEMEIEREEVE